MGHGKLPTRVQFESREKCAGICVSYVSEKSELLLLVCMPPIDLLSPDPEPPVSLYDGCGVACSIGWLDGI